MALTAYFDNSGTDAENPSLIVAGFASSAEQWNWFNDEWSRAQHDFGAPTFHVKHFNDARRGFGPYADWPKSKREDYLNTLLGIIVRRTHKSFGTALKKEAYELLIRPEQAFREYFYTPFALCSVNCVFQVCDWRSECHFGEPLLFVFDHGNKNLGQSV